MSASELIQEGIRVSEFRYQRAENELRIMTEITQGSIATPDLNEFLQLFHRSIGQILDAENCFVALHDPVRDLIDFEFWAHRSDPQPAPGPVDSGPTGYVLRTGQPLLLSEKTKESIHSAGGGTSAPSWIGVPLRTPERTIGVLALQHYEDDNVYCQRDLEFLTSVGDQIALTIDRKRAHEVLAESEERYRSVVAAVLDAIVTIDETSRILSVNSSAERIFGYTADEMVGASVTMLMPEYLRNVFKASLDRYVQQGQIWLWDSIVLPGLHSSGHEVPLELSCAEFSQGGRRYFTGIISDITDRKSAIEALEGKERLLADVAAELESERRRLAEAQAVAGLGSWHTDLLTMKVIWSAETHSIFETDPVQFHPDHEAFLQLVHPDDRPAVDKAFLDSLNANIECEIEHRILLADGRIKYVEERWRILHDEEGKAVSAAGSCRDITERRIAENTLREAEAKYRSIFENSNDGIFQSAPDGRLISANQALATLYGFDTPEELIQQQSVKAGQGYSAAELRETFEFLLEESDVVNGFEYEIQRKDGSMAWVSENARLVRDASGQPIYYEGNTRDITEERNSKEAVRESEERYRSIFENAIEGIFQATPEGKFISVNPAMARILGFDSPADLIAGRTDIGSQHYVQKRSRTTLERMLAAEGVTAGFECEVFRKDGSKIWTYENVRAVRDESGKILYYEGSIDDITERKQLEEQLRQSQKMEAVGVLAGGIAHDFNNLLTAINGYSDLTLKKMSPKHPLRRNILEVKEAGSRAAELTGQLLAFSRKQVLKSVVLNINTVVSTIERMLRRLIKESVELRVALDPKLGNVRADPSQIEQVIMNLAINARDAMPGGGTLTIETHNVYLDEDYVAQHINVSPGDFIRMTVTDTGEGMDAATQARIFEPFFTTKEVGKGTGLGLSTVYGIVKQSGGDITVKSEVGHGTTFTIYLPCVDATVQEPDRRGKRGGQKSSGTETILLVEDEEIVRTLVKEVLSGHGFNVLEAASGKAALAICKAHPEPIQLLLTDVIMPKMDGPELKSRIVKLRPDIKVLFMSGYTEDSVANREFFDSDTALIEKPFTPDGLARKIREVIGK